MWPEANILALCRFVASFQTCVSPPLETLHSASGAGAWPFAVKLDTENGAASPPRCLYHPKPFAGLPTPTNTQAPERAGCSTHPQSSSAGAFFSTLDPPCFTKTLPLVVHSPMGTLYEEPCTVFMKLQVRRGDGACGHVGLAVAGQASEHRAAG